MKAPDFQAALGDADRGWRRAGVSEAADRRLRGRLARRADRGGLARAGAGGGGATAATWRRRLALGTVALAVTGGAAALVMLGQGLSPVRAPAPIGLPAGVRLENASANLVLAEERAGVRIVRGRADLIVKKRPPGAEPVRVAVSHGAIEVRGTRFTVEQGERGGRVTLHEGAIRFLSNARKADSREASSIDLAPGQSLEWPVPIADDPANAAALPVGGAADDEGTRARRQPASSVAQRVATTARPEAPPQAAEPLELLLERIATLRSRGLFAEAVRELSRAVGRGDYPLAARDRLSYELGSLLSYQLGDRQQACAHWRAHTRTFGAGRYGREVAQASGALGCALR
jgi:transmembrane sensor